MQLHTALLNCFSIHIFNFLLCNMATSVGQCWLPSLIDVAVAAPSASPSALMVNPRSSTELGVTWRPVSRLQRNGHILGYKVAFTFCLLFYHKFFYHYSAVDLIVSTAMCSPLLPFIIDEEMHDF